MVVEVGIPVLRSLGDLLLLKQSWWVREICYVVRVTLCVGNIPKAVKGSREERNHRGYA